MYLVLVPGTEYSMDGVLVNTSQLTCGQSVAAINPNPNPRAFDAPMSSLTKCLCLCVILDCPDQTQLTRPPPIAEWLAEWTLDHVVVRSKYR